jgi:uncharacterized protein (UPF0371 family)
VARILEKISGAGSPYRSPTDMGVNRAGFGIVDDQAVREAAKQEVIARHFRYACEYAMGLVEREAADRARLLMEELGVGPLERPVVAPAREAAEEAVAKGKGNEGIFCGAAMELADGRIVKGRNSPLMHAASSVVLNAAKALAGIPDFIHILSPGVLQSIGRLKTDVLRMKAVSLDLDETLIALGMSAASNPAAEMALEKLKELAGCEVHMTHMPTPGDEAGLRRLGVNLTTEPNFSTKCLFVS